MCASRRPRFAAARVPLALSALLAAWALPIPLDAQSALPRGTVVEAYLARAVLDPAVAGDRARVEGIGARVLIPLPSLTDRALPGLLSRSSVGAFLTSIPERERGVEARHFGVQADVRPAAAPLAGRIEPLLSLGAGSFSGRIASSTRTLPAPLCLELHDAPVALAAQPCLRALPGRGELVRNLFALSPAAGVRLGVLPGLAVRAEVRDVIVHHGTARHNVEFLAGLSFLR